MTTQETWYASAPTSEVAIATLRIITPGEPEIRICDGFEDFNFGVDGVLQPFEACQLTITLPAKNTSGQQTLSFGTGGIVDLAQQRVDAAIAADAVITLVFAEYLISDRMTPMSRPLVMVLQGGQFAGDDLQFEGSYQDLLNMRWSREMYTTENAPGLRYLT